MPQPKPQSAGISRHERKPHPFAPKPQQESATRDGDEAVQLNVRLPRSMRTAVKHAVLDEGEDATVNGWLLDAIGLALSESSRDPASERIASDEEPSVQVNVRLPRSMRTAAKRAALDRDITVNQLVLVAIQRKLDNDDG